MWSGCRRDQRPPYALPSSPWHAACGPSAAGSPSLVTDQRAVGPAVRARPSGTSASPQRRRRFLVRSQPRASRCSRSRAPPRNPSGEQREVRRRNPTRARRGRALRAAKGGERTGYQRWPRRTGSPPDAGVRSCVSSSRRRARAPRAPRRPGQPRGPSIGSAAPARHPRARSRSGQSHRLPRRLPPQVSRAPRDEPPGGSHRRMLSAATPSLPAPVSPAVACYPPGRSAASTRVRRAHCPAQRFAPVSG